MKYAIKSQFLSINIVFIARIKVNGTMQPR